MGDLALLHSHRLYGKGRQSLWNLARQRKGAPSCSGAPWGEERGAWAVRPVYPDTPLQVKAPEGQDTLEEERGSPRLRGELVGTQTDGAGLGWASPKGPQGPISLLCFAVWTVVGLAAWFRDGCCSDPPLQEYQAIQQGSYPCPGTQAGPPGVIGTESPSPHCPPPPQTPTLQLQPMRSQPGSEALLLPPTEASENLHLPAAIFERNRR